MNPTSTFMPARTARRLITPGTVKTVHFHFVARGGRSGWLRVPKVEAKRLLRDLGANAIVWLAVHEDERAAYLGGELVGGER